MANNIKNKGTLLSRTLKVGENNVPSEFSFLSHWPRYGRFYKFAFQNQCWLLLGNSNCTLEQGAISWSAHARNNQMYPKMSNFYIQWLPIVSHFPIFSHLIVQNFQLKNSVHFPLASIFTKFPVNGTVFIRISGTFSYKN